MKLIDLKIGNYVKHKDFDSYFELINISGERPDQIYIFEKRVEQGEHKLQCQYNYNDDSLLNNFIKVDSIPENLLPI